MESRQELEATLTDQLLARGLERVSGQLAFVHDGQTVSLKADKTIYRGFFVTVLDRGQTVREFRSSVGSFDWDAVAAIIVDVAECRLEPNVSTGRIAKVDAADHSMPGELLALGSGSSSKLSMEPCQDRSGRVRVRLQDLDLDPVAALRLCAAVTRALATG